VPGRMRSSKTKDKSCTDQNSHWDRITLDTCGEKIHVGWQTISIYSTTAQVCRDELVDETLVWERMQLSSINGRTRQALKVSITMMPSAPRAISQMRTRAT